MLQPVTADKLCRACAALVEANRQEEAFKQFQKFRQLYSSLSDLKVYDDDDLPKLLCASCADLLEKIEIFKEACTRSVDSIRKLIIANLKEEPIEEIVSAETLEPIVKAEVDETENLQVDKKVRRGQQKRPVTKSPNNVQLMWCDLCGNTYASKRSLRKHMQIELRRRSENQIKPDKANNLPKKDRNLSCTHEGCGRIFFFQKNLDSHLKTHKEDEVSNFCSPCNKRFVTAGHYRRHMSIFHIPPKATSLVCSTCDKSFSRADKLKAHILSKHPEETKKFACTKCSVGFVFENELELHQTRFHKEFVCHHCGKSRPSKTTMRNHLIKKHTYRAYEACTICRIKVLQINSLNHYIQKHSVLTTVKSIIQCKHCGREFSRRPLLNRHIKIHTGERPHVCHQCGKSFLRWNCLKKHFLSHSGLRPMHCAHCGKGVHNKHALNIHMNIHKREWIAQGQTGIELMVYATSNKSKNSNEKKYANLKQPSA